MAERTLNTRIKLRYASYAEWMASSVQLLPGEVAVCYVEANNEQIKNTAPTVLFKVGDGEHTFSGLQWSSARAADVYDWAKTATKPEYTKGEIGLGNVLNVASYAKTETYNKSEVDSKVKEVKDALQTDTNTTYRFVTNANSITVFSKEKDSDEEQVMSFTVNLSELEGEIESINEQIGEINEELAKKANASDVYTKTEIQGFNTSINEEITALEEDVEALDLNMQAVLDGTKKAKNAEHADEADLAARAEKDKNGNDIADTYATKAKVEEVEGKFDDYTTTTQLNGLLDEKANKDSTEESIRQINNNFNNYYTKTESDNLFMTSDEVDSHINQIISSAVDGDTLTNLTDIVKYINTHGGEATEMANAIIALESQLIGIAAGSGTVKKYIDDAISALKIGDYAKAADLAALADRVSSIEKKPAYTITAQDIDAWDNAESNAVATAKDYTDAEIVKVNESATALSNRIKTVEDDYLKAKDKEELVGAIGAEQDRIDTLVDTTVPGLDNRIKALEDKPFNTYATKSEVQEVSGEVTKVDNRVKTIEADYLKASDKTELSGLVTAEKTRAEAAEKGLGDRLTAVENNYLSSADVIVWDCGGAN